MKVLGFLSFIGRAYYGFQRQPNKVTVQGTVEEALSSLLGEETKIKGAGRTDAGVNAHQYPFAFPIAHRVNLSRLCSLLNRRLPIDISCSSLLYVDDSFDPRHSSVEKTYIYRFSVKKKHAALSDSVAYLGDYDFDLESFKAALRLFEGEHDFSNFTSKKEDVDGFVRILRPIEVIFDEEEMIGQVIFRSNGFMTYQIRLMVGYAFRVAFQRSTIEELTEALRKKPRAVTHYKALANGLTLEEVTYERIPLL